jgi:dolichol-phosphate mannosyltransferase
MENNRLNLLSLIVPVYNEVETLPHLRVAIEGWKVSLGTICLEVILVNDGSMDGSDAFCIRWASEDAMVKYVQFSRNFGHQQAVSAGLACAQGDVAVIIDADLQDPLSVINTMIKKYEDGFDIVYGQRSARHGETKFKKFTAWLYYRIMRRFVHKNLPVDTGDFRLISRRCIEVFNAMPETHRFLRGMFAWMGFKQTSVLYERHKRLAGKTKYPLYKMLSFAWSGITSFSSFPIRLLSLVGVFFAFFGFGVCLYSLVSYFFSYTVQGWTSLMGVQSLLSGMILLSVGIVGEYVGKIYEEVKNRPSYIISKKINL